MGGRAIPEHPDFAHASERLVWDAIRRQLADDDVVVHGLRLTDPNEGDVEIDLLLLLPDAGVVVIEVKGGHISFREGQVRQTDRTGSRSIDPFEQARRAQRAVVRYLEGHPRWSRGPVRCTWLVCFPHTPVREPLGPEGHLDVVVGMEELGDIVSRAVDRLRQPSVRGQVPPEGWVDRALDLVHEATDDESEHRSRAESRRRKVEQITRSKEDLLSFISPNPRYEVVGPAGSGKTWLAMAQAHRWSREGRRVALVTYGRGVASMAKAHLDQLPRRQRPAFVGTFHALGHLWGVDLGVEGDSHEWVDGFGERVRAKALGLPPGQRFSAFVVDEAQDFTDSWWAALLAARLDDDVRVAAFRDEAQAVFVDRAGHPGIDLVPFRLDENLRNADQVAEAFRPLVGSPFRARGGPGVGVEFVPCAAGDEISTADDVIDRLLGRDGWLPEDVALLTTRHRHPVQREYRDRLEYWADLFDRDLVFYCTVAGFKGLERSTIVLAVDGFHEGVDPAKVMYTGMSRATDHLVVVGDPDAVRAAVGPTVMRRLTLRDA